MLREQLALALLVSTAACGSGPSSSSETIPPVATSSSSTRAAPVIPAGPPLTTCLPTAAVARELLAGLPALKQGERGKDPQVQLSCTYVETVPSNEVADPLVPALSYVVVEKESAEAARSLVPEMRELVRRDRSAQVGTAVRERCEPDLPVAEECGEVVVDHDDEFLAVSVEPPIRGALPQYRDLRSAFWVGTVVNGRYTCSMPPLGVIVQTVELARLKSTTDHLRRVLRRACGL